MLDTLASDLSSIALKQTIKYKSIHDHPDLININASAIMAFKKMVAHGVSALAVVDDAGVLVSKISTTDVTGLDKRHIEAGMPDPSGWGSCLKQGSGRFCTGSKMIYSTNA